jgi:RluA family pseudouridine synthase
MSKTIQPEIIFADEHLLLVNKPANMLSLPDRYNASLPNMRDWLQALYGKIYVVHRLDRETSGIMCFARTTEAHLHLSRQFNQRSVEKNYLVLVDGQFAEPEGVIDLPIGENMAKRGTKPSLTLWRVEESFAQFTLVQCNIKTGRMHQIRVHMLAIGHPPAVDPIYGKRDAFYLSQIKRKYKVGKFQETEQPLMQRVTLHAFNLLLQHPQTLEEMNFDAPLPKDFAALLRQLRLHNAQ